MFILIRDTHHRHAISLRPGVVVYVRVVVVCEGYPYSDQHPARRRLSLLLSRSRQDKSFGPGTNFVEFISKSAGAEPAPAKILKKFAAGPDFNKIFQWSLGVG